jgi:hypothetical protein
MPQFEVTFTVFRSNEPGKASVSSSSMTNLKTVVEARHANEARALIQGQYGSKCSIYGVRPL